jgi:hypothetical protein
VPDKRADVLLEKDIPTMRYTMLLQGVAHRYSLEDTAEYVARSLGIDDN